MITIPRKVLVALAGVVVGLGAVFTGLAATNAGPFTTATGCQTYADQGTTFALNGSGQFSDSLTGDTGNSSCAVSYQVKIYEINTGLATPTAPSGSFTPAYWAKFSNGFPSSSSWFPIGVFDEGGNPGTGGNVPSPCANQGCQMAAEHLNFVVQADNSPPSQSLVTSTINNLCAYNVYGILWHNVTTSGPEPVSLLQNGANAANSGCAGHLAGYQIGDENCAASEVTTINSVLAADPTRMANLGESGGNIGDSTCYTTQNASSIVSGDTYPITNPYATNCNVAGQQSDCLWEYGVQTARYVYHDTGGKPVFVDQDPGTTNLGFSSQGSSTCNYTTNLCSKGNEAAATPVQVNSATWETLINGANGVFYFCPDTYASDACLGGGSGGNAANCNQLPNGPNGCLISPNLTWIDSQVESYAQELNSPSAGYCRMISSAIGGNASYSPPYSSCTGGDLSVSTSNSAEPVVAMTKNVGGVTYLFTAADHGSGSTTATYTIAGAANDTATLVYDSAQHYQPGSGGGTTTTTTQPATTTTTLPATTTTSTSTTTTSTSTTTTTIPATTTTTTQPVTTTPISCNLTVAKGSRAVTGTCVVGSTTVTCTGTYIGARLNLVCKT